MKVNYVFILCINLFFFDIKGSYDFSDELSYFQRKKETMIYHFKALQNDKSLIRSEIVKETLKDYSRSITRTNTIIDNIKKHIKNPSKHSRDELFERIDSLSDQYKKTTNFFEKKIYLYNLKINFLFALNMKKHRETLLDLN